MQLLHVIALGPRERLALVKVGSRFLVVGVTAAGISAVTEFTGDSLEAQHTPDSGAAPAGRSET